MAGLLLSRVVANWNIRCHGIWSSSCAGISQRSPHKNQNYSRIPCPSGCNHEWRKAIHVLEVCDVRMSLYQFLASTGAAAGPSLQRSASECSPVQCCDTRIARRIRDKASVGGAVHSCINLWQSCCAAEEPD